MVFGGQLGEGEVAGNSDPSLVAQTVKRLSTMRETRVRSLGREDPLEKEMATHSSILAWRIPRTEDPGGLWSMGSQESDTTERLNRHHRQVPQASSRLLVLEKALEFSYCVQFFLSSPFTFPAVRHFLTGRDAVLLNSLG